MLARRDDDNGTPSRPSVGGDSSGVARYLAGSGHGELQHGEDIAGNVHQGVLGHGVAVRVRQMSRTRTTVDLTRTSMFCCGGWSEGKR